MNKIAVWNLLISQVGKKKPAALLYVLDSQGSSPGRAGFHMAVTDEGFMEGSIGGGMMEYKLVELAKDRLVKKDALTSDLRKQVHDKSASRDQSGMICSGEQTVWIYEPSEKDLPAMKDMVASMEREENGTIRLSPEGVQFSSSITQRDYSYHFTSADNWYYEEKTGFKNHLYIIGGGHCALALSKLMSGMDFCLHLFEDRKDLHTMQQNNWVKDKRCLESYEELKNLILSGTNHYIVIMTFGYRTDDISLRALLGKQFKYLGLLGSRKKIEQMFETYESEGIPRRQLSSIHAPIGLSIHSHTPEEIAVSVAAEIIKVKNESL